MSHPNRARLFDIAILSLILFGVTILCYVPVKENAFINFDDQVYLTNNQFVKQGLTSEAVKYAFTSGDVGNWHPVTWLSHLVDVQLFGMDAGRHHLVSAVIHALNGVLLLWVLRALTGSLWASAFVAAAFALHPLRVESVAWASERKDLLAALFGFIAIGLYHRFTRRKAEGARWGVWYGLALLAQALSLMCKPMLVTLPCLLLLLDFWPLKRLRLDPSQPSGVPLRQLLVEKLPFLALTVMSSVVTMIVQAGAGAVATTQVFTWETRINNAVLTVFKYLQKLFWPTNLSPFYPYDLQPASTLVAVCALGVGIIIVWCWLARIKSPHLTVGWLWYLGLLVPVIGLVQVGSQGMADRYTYLPIIGVLIVIAWSARGLLIRWPTLKVPAAVGTAVLLGWLGLRSQDQVLLWRDSETLFNHAMAVTKDNAIAHESMGLVLAERGMVKQAAWHFAQAVRIWPKYADAYSDLGLALSLQGKYQKAIEYALKAVELSPETERMQYNVAKIYSRLGSNAVARVQFESFLGRFPGSEAGTLSLAELYLADRDPGKAVSLLNSFVSRKAASDETYFALGQALAAANKGEEAIATLRQVVERNPKHDRAWYQLGSLLLPAGKPAEALIALQNAQQIKPTVEGLLAMAEAHSALRNDAEAIANYERAIEMNPDVPGTLNNLAWLLATVSEARLRNGKRAVELGEKACQLTESGEPFLLGTLAAAYAEAGDFDKAMATAQKAIELANAAGKSEVVARNNELLELYRAHQPYHEPAPVK